MDVATKMEVWIYTPEKKHLPILQKRVWVEWFLGVYLENEWYYLQLVCNMQVSNYLVS